MAQRMVLVVLWLVASVELSSCWGEETMENAKDGVNIAAGNARLKAEEARQGAAEAMQDAKDKGDSWSDWAYDKLSGGFGINLANTRWAAQRMMNTAGDAASKATDSMNSAASESSSYASQKADEAARVASQTASNARELASEKMDQTIHKAGETKETMTEAMEQGKSKAAGAYGDAKQRLNAADGGSMMGDSGERMMNMATDAFGETKKKVGGDTYDYAKQKGGEMYSSAKETMSQQAKGNYEAAKEKASQAAADVGVKMRTKDASEL